MIAEAALVFPDRVGHRIRVGYRVRSGTGLASGTGLVRIAEASWSARAAQDARVPRLHEALRLCGVPRLHELVLPIIIYLCVVLSR